VAAVCTNDTMVAAFGSLMNSHWAPTVCAQEPTLLSTTPIHSHRKARLWKGASAPTGGSGTGCALMAAPCQKDRGMCGM